jgi:hypothetical protein
VQIKTERNNTGKILRTSKRKNGSGKMPGPEKERRIRKECPNQQKIVRIRKMPEPGKGGKECTQQNRSQK